MFTVILDFEENSAKVKVRQIIENLTAKELGATLTELSKQYVLLFDTVTNFTTAVGCTICFTVTDRK